MSDQDVLDHQIEMLMRILDECAAIHQSIDVIVALLEHGQPVRAAHELGHISSMVAERRDALNFYLYGAMDE